MEIGTIVTGSWGRVGRVIDLYGREEGNRIYTYAVVQYAEGDTEILWTGR